MLSSKTFIPSKEECLKILRKYNTPAEVIQHCVVVTEVAEELIANICYIEKELVIAGAMLHDIGRSQNHDISHAVLGVRILEKENIDSRIISIVERHIGTGISKKETYNLKLPPKDYIPQTTEEIIVSYADNLTCGIKICSFEETLKKFIHKFGENSSVVKGFYKQKDFVTKLKNKEIK